MLVVGDCRLHSRWGARGEWGWKRAVHAVGEGSHTVGGVGGEGHAVGEAVHTAGGVGGVPAMEWWELSRRGGHFLLRVGGGDETQFHQPGGE